MPTHNRTPHPYSPLALCIFASFGLLAESALAANSADPALETVTVTGTRGEQRTVISSPAPIDVIPAEQLKTVGRDGLMETLNALLPSYNLPAMSGAGASGVIRAAGLRGLNADQVLVLVNGKRRHNSGLLQSGSWTSSGSTPADLDLIPANLIERIEVLRDGAAAQYGSDAIAGVINIILKQQDSGGQASASYGQNFLGDGSTRQESVSHGFALPNDGFVHLALENRNQDRFTRAEPVVREGFAANGVTRVPKAYEVVNEGYGNPESKITNFAYNAELPLSNGTSLYSFSTLSHRDGYKHANFRQATANGNITEIYPDGASAKRPLDEDDFQVVFGGRGELAGWNTDLSTSYSRDYIRLTTSRNLNASFGPASPTTFYMGSQTFKQWVNNLDFTQAFDTGLAKPTQVSFGVEHRYEDWKLGQGEYLSWARGDYVYTSGPFAGQEPNTSSSVRGVSPDDAGQADRNVYAGYVDVGFYPTDKLYTAVALRHERYDDSAGSTTNGKLTTRYDFTPEFALRATVSNGFRAPSLAQSVYQQSSVSSYQATTNGYTQYYYKHLAPDSAVGQALGAKELKPEKSQNFSVGFTWQPLPQMTTTLDVYQINIDDRLVLSDILTGRDVVAVMESYGLRDFNGAQFYTNAVDTRTRGVDLLTDYRADYGQFGTVRWSAALNHNETKIENIKDDITTPSGAGIFGHSAQGYLLRGNPRDKIILGADWRVGQWRSNLRVTRFGEVTQPGSTQDTDRSFGAKWITDLNVGYDFSNGVSLEVGANNLFDVVPDKNGITSSTGLGQYGYISPFGFGGGYWYTRLAYNF
ncbi:TonB-dependent receptor plug domain-containing protein [Pseudomonas huaxiensis]|uniref:TonB-dependent receptor plug domain-containing protein n=1 Tax=Pseudomonas huaxiensis TaxID=2213017 RepID=UPI0015AB493D|nr:TonB-dependent receptor [Pseudomonas huaxiensis]